MDDQCNLWYHLNESTIEYASSGDNPEDIVSASILDQGYVSSVEFSTSDERGEEVHTIDSLSLLLICCLLGATVITIWIFKAKRLRIFHETGLSLIYGRIAKIVNHCDNTNYWL